MNEPSPWWQTAVLYQIYPRSFADSNGDGVGDLPGITAHLDYLVSLGADAIWLSPFYASPMVDFGYDITDHQDVDPVFGTLDDAARLIQQSHRRGLRVLVDYVPNHTSDQHPWFLDARSSRSSSKRDWYVWANPAPDGGPPNNWLSTFPDAGRAWTLDQTTGQYYLHSYTKEQPDLNWRNPEVREAMKQVMRFWLDLGVDGFRLDAIYRLIKNDKLKNNPPEAAHVRTGLVAGATSAHHFDQPEVHEVLRELRAVFEEYGADRVLLGEVGVADAKRWAAYYGDGDELMLSLNFMFWKQSWSADGFRRVVEATERALPPGAWPVYALGNHDFSRFATRFGSHQRARLASMMLLTLRGTPLLYYGDEIGMTDVDIPPHLANDPNGRDPVRTPMQWDASSHAGFSAVTPWLPVPNKSRVVNVASQISDCESLLHFYMDLLKLRRHHPALQTGNYVAEPAIDEIFAYTRADADGNRILIALNFGEKPTTLEHPGVQRARVMLSTHDRNAETSKAAANTASSLTLAPYEGIVIELAA